MVNWKEVLKDGGKFKFKKDEIVKNQEELYKRDKRKKLIKTDKPTLKRNRKINKKQQGGTINGQPVTYDYAINPEVFTSWNSVKPVNSPTYDERVASLNLPVFQAVEFIDQTQDEATEGYSDFNELDPIKSTITENFKEEIKQRNPGTIIIPDNINIGNSTIKGFIDVARRAGINFKVTSGYRPGGMTTSGFQSWHARDGGNALDIVPINQTFDQLKEQIQDSPEVLQYLRDNKLGILEETNEEILKKTGGTGYHFHIGGDQSALQNLRSYAPSFVRNAQRFIQSWEGFKDKPYWDSIGKKWTIGHGLTSKDLVEKHQSGITPQESTQYILDHINSEILPYFEQQSYWNRIDDNLKSSLIDAAYGLGIRGFKKSNNLINLLNAEQIDKDAVVREMNWNLNSNDGRRERSRARQLLGLGRYNHDSVPYSGNYLNQG